MSEAPAWEVPGQVDLAMQDLVLVHTVCRTQPGAAIQVVIMEQREVPVLAQLGSASDRMWCVSKR